ncbi:MAG: hypothetical protein NC084_07510 [Bacteroides sp.]|nr:hypothetical protein [Eubacterium sp.]MCM1417511.1 hypothetical protein [Roseburia sp.]MCM1462546.1 hypothetical protein [Bacteroides sp.]
MDAIHVNATMPFFSKRRDGIYSIEKFGLYTAVLSALAWRRRNGRIFLCTDRVGAAYYRRLGIERVWDEIRDVIPTDQEGIDPEMFWAAGKLIALRETAGDYALVDEDFIVWKKLELSKTAVTAAHREAITPEIYPDPRGFGADFPLLERLDPTVLPCNTAFLYIPDESFRRFYASQSIAFMKSAPKSGDPLCPMVFAEQRLLSMLCAMTKTPIETLLDYERLFVAQDDYTHLWGAKQAMRDDPARREAFLTRCRKRIESDFPEYRDVIERIEAGTPNEPK